MENGTTTESAISGNEGPVGIVLLKGGEMTPSRAVAQSAGHQGAGSPRPGKARMRVLCGRKERIRSLAAVFSPIDAARD